MTSPEDREVDEYLAGRSEVSRRYAALEQESPAAALDARIHAKAREALTQPLTSDSNVDVHGPRRWIVPVALAATVLLSFSLLYRLGVGPDNAPAIGEKPPAVIVIAPPVEPAAVPAPTPAEEPVEVPPAEAVIQPRAEPSTDGNASRDASPASPVPDTEMRSVPDTAVPGFGAEQLARAIAAARRALDGGERLARQAAPAREVESSAADKAVALQPAPAAAASMSAGAGADTATERLREIVTDYDAGRIDAAALALERFAADFPDHPVSRLVLAPRD